MKQRVEVALLQGEQRKGSEASETGVELQYVEALQIDLNMAMTEPKFEVLKGLDATLVYSNHC